MINDMFRDKVRLKLLDARHEPHKTCQKSLKSDNEPIETVHESFNTDQKSPS